MFILDTNVISEGFRVRPSAIVKTWLDARPPEDLFLCAPVLAELRYGIERLAVGARRAELENLLSNFESQLFGNRLLPIDRDSAYEFGRIVAKRKYIGRPIAPMDALIAAIAISHRMAIATRDTNDFAELDLELINPFDPDTGR